MSARIEVGQMVRINAGQDYGKIGTVVALSGDALPLVDVRVNGKTEMYRTTELLDSHANNGD